MRVKAFTQILKSAGIKVFAQILKSAGIKVFAQIVKVPKSKFLRTFF
jgi:uncharacterized protein with GYD domain